MTRLRAFWDRLSFFARLLTTASVALLAAATLMVFVSAGEAAREAQADLTAELAAELETLPAALAETVVVGDFATLQQTLDRYVQRPKLHAARFDDTSGVMLSSVDQPRPYASPKWFRALLRFEDISDSAAVLVGGRSYGTLTLTLSAQSGADHTWRHLIGHIGILTLAIGIDFVGIWWALRTGLAPLRSLETGAEALAAGDYARRLSISGGPELRRLFVAFNRMAAALQSTHTQLQRRNAELQRFSEISAHHLQEPARRLMIFAQRLSRHLPADIGEDDHKSLIFINQEAARLRNLLRDIELYLAAHQPLDKIAWIDPAVVAQKAARRLAGDLKEAGGTLTVASSAPLVRLDQRRLEELFFILFDNAVRYRRLDAPLAIDVSFEQNGDKVRLRVADNGTGVAPAFHEKAFGVFERLQSQPGDVATGVGLAIVRRIAESTGGGAWIEEKAKPGLTVIVELGVGQEA